MKKRFTILIAALMLLVFMTPSMAAWGQTYTLATSIAVGDEVVLVNAAVSVELSGIAASNYGTVEDVENTTPSGLYPLTVVAGNTEGSFAFKTPDNTYLQYTGGSNTLSTTTDVTNASSWTVSIANTIATIINVNTNNRRIQYNPGNSNTVPRFACYKNTMSNGKLYKRSGPTKLSTPTNFQATAGNGQAEFTWNAVTNASGYTISYSASGNEQTATINSGSTTSTTISLTNSTTYTCKIKAIGDGTNYSDSEYSDEISVTPTAAQQYTVTIANGITGGSVEANPTTATAGTTINVTANPNGGYYLSELSYTDGQTTTDIDQTTLQFEMPASDVTINATFTPYTVTLNANGSTSTWNVTMNGGNLPDAAAPCASWSFYGWSTAAANTQTTTAPTTMVNGTGYTPTSNNTLYAVYKKTEGGGSNTDSSVTLSNGVFTDATSTDPAYITWTEDFITIVQEKGSNSNASPVANYTTNPRWYQYHVITLTPSVTVNSIAITQYDSKYGLEDSNTSISNGTMSVSNHVATITPTNGNQAVVITMGAQARISAISVNHVASTTYYHSTPDCVETVATPSFDVNEGTYHEPQIIIIECETAGASIYYTLNGEEPTSTESATNFLYDENEGVEISSTTTLKAKAFKTGMNPSATRTATYTIIHDVAEPTLAESQLFTTDTYSVAITVPANTTVYYTTDGTAPTNASTQYTAAFNINATTTVKAIAYDGDGCASDVVSATYTRAYTLAGAKALYNGSDVSNVIISLAGVQFIAKSGSSYTYVQQGTDGLLIFGSHSQNLTKGDVFTAGTITGTITKYGDNMEIKNFSFSSDVAKEAGTLSPTTTDVTIDNINSNFATYESRYVALTSLTMNLTGNTLSDGTNTLDIYDSFGVLDGAIQPSDNVVVKGIVTSSTSATNKRIIPLALTDITTGVDATLPTLTPAGGATAAEAETTATVKITPAASTSVTYVFGNGDEVTTTEEVTVDVPSTSAVSLTLSVSRDFYVDKVAKYYYKSNAASYTVNFYENGALTHSEDNVVSGTSLAISSTTAPNGYEFMGWTTSPISGVSATAPDPLYTAGISIAVNDNLNLYAVYALAGENTVTYTLVGAGDVTEGTYIIGALRSTTATNDFYFADGSITTTNDKDMNTNTTAVTINEVSNVRQITELPAGAMEFVFSGNATDGFSICKAGTTAYLGYTSTSTNRRLAFGSSYNETLWKAIAKDNPLLTNGVTLQTSSYKISENSTGQSAIRGYSGSAYRALYLFKKAETPAYSNYCTTITYTTYNGDEIRTTPILANEIVTVPNGTVLTLNTTNGGTAANLIIEDGGILITHTDGIQATVEKNITGAGESNWGEPNPENPYTPTGWYFIASPVNGAAFPTGTNDNQDIYQLDWTNNKWLNIQNGHSSLLSDGFQRGTGYLYASKDGNTVSVAGEIQPLSGDDDATVTLAVDGWNLIGNPLTCKVEVDKAFSELNNASAVTNQVAGSAINPCQGIAVYGKAGDVVTFAKAASQNAAAPSNNSSLQMTLAKTITSRGDVSTKVVDNAVVSFKESKCMPKFNMIGGNTKLFIPQDDEEYSIVFSDRQGDVPLYFKANETGTYTISFAGDEMSLNGIYLIDILAEEEIDLSVNPSYTFIGSPADRMARFKIVFRNANGDGTSDIFAYQNGNDIIVSGEGELQIFDVMGRMVSRQRVNGVEAINILTQGVYIMKLNEKTQKIVVR